MLAILDRPSVARPRATATAPVHFRVEPARDDGVMLSLHGRLPRPWSGWLAGGLAAHGVSLRRGFAREIGVGRWAARLELDLGWSTPAGLDFLELATSPPRVPAYVVPRLLDVEVTQSDAGGVRVEVHAWDCVGLLASVLERAAALGMHPTGIRLETEAECAFHWLRLRDESRARPSADRVRALRRALERLLVGG